LVLFSFWGKPLKKNEGTLIPRGCLQRPRKGGKGGAEMHQTLNTIQIGPPGKTVLLLGKLDMNKFCEFSQNISGNLLKVHKRENFFDSDFEFFAFFS
jgi:hypothetical protein